MVWLRRGLPAPSTAAMVGPLVGPPDDEATEYPTEHECSHVERKPLEADLVVGEAFGKPRDDSHGDAPSKTTIVHDEEYASSFASFLPPIGPLWIHDLWSLTLFLLAEFLIDWDGTENISYPGEDPACLGVLTGLSVEWAIPDHARESSPLGLRVA